MAPPTRTPRHVWIDAGLEALATGGPDAVRVDVLAQGLGVTRGGFYWHFADRQGLLNEMLDTWERQCTDDVLERVERSGGDAPTRARRARALTFAPPLLSIDLAVRDWARRDPAVADRLRRVDNRRMDYLRTMFASVSDDENDVEARCLLAFSMAIGHHFIAADHRSRSRAEVLDEAVRQLFS